MHKQIFIKIAIYLFKLKPGMCMYIHKYHRIAKRARKLNLDQIKG